MHATLKLKHLNDAVAVLPLPKIARLVFILDSMDPCGDQPPELPQPWENPYHSRRRGRIAPSCPGLSASPFRSPHHLRKLQSSCLQYSAPKAAATVIVMVLLKLASNYKKRTCSSGTRCDRFGTTTAFDSSHHSKSCQSQRYSKSRSPTCPGGSCAP